jgi:hypothetical protein
VDETARCYPVGDKLCLEAADDDRWIIDEGEMIYWGTCSVCQTGRRGNRPRRDPTVSPHK